MTVEPDLDELLSRARAFESALTLALRVGDETATLLAVARLRLVADQLSETLAHVGSRSEGHGSTVAAMLSASLQRIDRAREGAPVSIVSCDQQRLRRWLMAMGQTMVRRKGPHLFEMDAEGICLRSAQLFDLHVSHCRLITDLRDAHFRNTMVESSDLTYANLDDSVWQDSTVHRSFLRESTLLNVTFHDAAFFDCDLRGAKLALKSLGTHALPASVQFVRCDLRGSQWFGADLRGVELIECKLHRAEFPMDCQPPRISRSDFSLAGDGSVISGVTHLQVKKADRPITRNPSVVVNSSMLARAS